MKKIFASFFICLVAFAGMAQTRKKAVKNKQAVNKLTLRTVQDSLSYAFAVNIIKEMHERGIKTLNYNVLNRAIQDGTKDKENLLTPVQAKEVIGRNIKLKFKQNLDDGQAFLAANKLKPGIVTLPSGLQYEVIQQGTGPLPALTDTMTVHYTGALINGKKFDSSYDSKEPIVGPPTNYIKGWQEGLLLMNAGSKYRLFIPFQLAYGDRDLGEMIPPYSTLVFDVEVLKVGK